MADPSDLVRAWQEALQQLRKVASPDLDQLSLGKLIAPIQRQAELVEEALDQIPAAMRAQAKAFQTAAFSFNQAAEILEAQAAVMERAISTIKLPADLVRSVGGRALPRSGAKKPAAKKKPPGD